MGRVEGIFDESGDDGSLPNILFSYEYNFLFFYISFVGGVAYFVLIFIHFEFSYLIIYN